MFKGKPISKYHSHFSPELEFILLDESYDINKLHLDSNLKNDNYFVPPSEKVDKALMAMMKNLTSMGLKREIYHTEVTSYQCEIGISFGNVSRMADGVVTAKYIISQTAQAHGLRASFIPKFREGVNRSGMHVHQNLAATLLEGTKPENLFFDISRPDGLSQIGESYIAGLLKYAREITAITNPLPISYKRLVPGAEAPTYIAWDWQNRTALARGHSRGTKAIRVEYRSPDPKCNPYLAFAAMLAAGLSGIEQDLKSDPADKRDFYHDNKGVRELPGNLGESLNEMVKSEMLRSKLGDEIVDALYSVGSNEWQKSCRAITDFDITQYI
jgi:glutamine synthetase